MKTYVLVLAAAAGLIALLVLAFQYGQRAATQVGSAVSERMRTGPTRAREVLEVDVQDASGRPVQDAQVMLKKQADQFWNASWTGVTNGRGTVTSRDIHVFGNETTDGAYDVAVRAPGFAPTFGTVALPRPGPLLLTMGTGRLVRVQLRAPADRPLPATLRPGVVLQGYENMWRHQGGRFADGMHAALGTMSSDSLVLAEPEGDGRFRLQMPDHPDSYRIMVEEPGYLRAFLTDFRTANPDELQVIDLPAAATLKVSVTVEKRAVETSDISGLSLDLMAYYTDPDGKRHGNQIGSYWIEPAGPAAFTDQLAPGTYRLHAGPVRRSGGRDAEGCRFTGQGDVKLAARETVERTLRYELIDPVSLAGDARAVLTLLGLDGQPAAGRPWRVSYSDRETRDYPVSRGTVPEDGRVVLEGLRAGDGNEHYGVELDGQRLGGFSFRKGKRLIEQTFRRAPDVGDAAPSIKLIRMIDGAEVDTGSFTGQVVYLDFWATWCGPCQGPMGALHDLARRRAEKWKGRAILAAVSIDDDLPTLTNHVAERGWTAPLHLWAGEGKGWRSTASQAYGIHGVPTGVLYDQRGRIVWRGNPGHREAEIVKQIEDLLGTGAP